MTLWSMVKPKNDTTTRCIVHTLRDSHHTQNVNNNSTNLTKMHIWCIFTPNKQIMARQSISISDPNDEWLKSQLDSKEYSSKSELVNDLIRQARNQQAQLDWIKAKLDKAEKSGFTTDTKAQILQQSKDLLRG